MFLNTISRRFCDSKMSTLGSLTSEIILSKSNIDKCMENIRILPSLIPEELIPKEKAAVLLPVCVQKNNQISILYTLRAAHLKTHSGQVSFPGGKYDDADESLVVTALRETEEEIGLPRNLVRILGEFPYPFPSKDFKSAVIPVIGVIENFQDVVLKRNESEVEEIFSVPLEKLCDQQYFGFTEFKNGYTMPVFMGGTHKIWGLTAVFTHLFLSCLLPESEYPMRFKHLTMPELKSKV